MSNLIEHNAYRIFGLDNSSNQKDILKRYNEIINRLKIDDHPEYDLDINLPDNLRTEESVNDALKRLQNVKNNIKEYFFWFQIADTVDEKALTYLRNKDYAKAILIWKNTSDTMNSTSLFYKKNLTLLYCLMLLKEQNITYLKESLSNWHEIVNSDKFWVTFAKSYGVNNEQTVSSDMILDFRNNVVKYISDIYFDLYQQYKNEKYVKDFQEVFGTHGEKTENSLLKPIYEEIHKDIDELNKIKFTTDGEKKKSNIFAFWRGENEEKEYQKKLRNIKSLIESIETQLSKLQEMGLYEDSQSKVVRDHAAEALRTISVELHNINQFEESSRVLKIAIPLCGTDSFKSKVQEDLKTVNNNFENKKKQDSYNKIIEPIISDWKSCRADKAFAKIDEQLANKDLETELRTILQDIKKSFQERIAEHGKPIKDAPSMSTINGIGTRIYGDTLYFVFIFIPIFPIARYSLSHNGDGSYSFYGKLELHKWQKYWIYGLIGIIVIWIIWAKIQS